MITRPIDKNGGRVIYICGIDAKWDYGWGGKYELAVENIFHKGFRLLRNQVSIGNIIFRMITRQIDLYSFSLFFFFLREKECKIRRIVFGKIIRIIRLKTYLL